MTNGEKFKDVFGFGADGSRVIAVNSTWWDCEYQSHKRSNEEWIPVEERLPNKYENVLVYSTRVGRRIDFITNDGNWMYTVPKVTHWMPLPEPPKG